MRARHRVGHGVEPGLGSLGRRRACQSAGCHRAIVRSTPAVALRPSVRRRQACGYVDNARALPTYPQVQQTTLSIKLIASKEGPLRPCPSPAGDYQPKRSGQLAHATAPALRGSEQPFTALSGACEKSWQGHNSNGLSIDLHRCQAGPGARSRNTVRRAALTLAELPTPATTSMTGRIAPCDNFPPNWDKTAAVRSPVDHRWKSDFCQRRRYSYAAEYRTSQCGRSLGSRIAQHRNQRWSVGWSNVFLSDKPDSLVKCRILRI